MGETSGRVRVRTKTLDGKVVTESEGQVYDSDGRADLLRKAARVNSIISGALSQYESRRLLRRPELPYLLE